MARIRGKFAPLMAELGNDKRWLMECDRDQKLLYILVLYTIYTTNGTAPDDPTYYNIRYNLRQRKDKITAGLARIQSLFPKLVNSNKKLSLLNSMYNENRVDTIEKTMRGEGEVEEEREREVDIEGEVKDKIPKVSLFDAYLKTWNEKMPFKVKILSKQRTGHLKERIKEPLFVGNFEKICDLILKSDFLSGRKPSKEHPNFKADLDWLIKNDTNYIKVLEGKYVDTFKHLTAEEKYAQIKRERDK